MSFWYHHWPCVTILLVCRSRKAPLHLFVSFFAVFVFTYNFSIFLLKSSSREMHSNINDFLIHRQCLIFFCSLALLPIYLSRTHFPPHFFSLSPLSSSLSHSFNPKNWASQRKKVVQTQSICLGYSVLRSYFFLLNLESASICVQSRIRTSLFA